MNREKDEVFVDEFVKKLLWSSEHPSREQASGVIALSCGYEHHHHHQI